MYTYIYIYIYWLEQSLISGVCGCKAVMSIRASIFRHGSVIYTYLSMYTFAKYMLLVLLLLFASFDVCCFEFLMTVKHLTECGIQAAMCSPQAPERWQDVWERDVSGELALCFSEVPIASIISSTLSCYVLVVILYSASYLSYIFL